MDMKRTVIVDIDGTISKVGDRLKFLKQTPKDWDSFYNDCFEDEPILEIIDLDELRKKPHKSSVCGMNCVFFRIYLFISKLFVIFVV